MRRRRVRFSSSPAAFLRSCSSRPIWVSFACACLRLRLLVAEALARSARAARCRRRRARRSSRRACARAARSSRHCVPRAREVEAAPALELEHGRRHGLEEPAVVRHEHDRGVERRELLLEPLERFDVEVVRGLVEQQQVGIAGERPRQRGARQLAAREGGERAVEIGVAEPEPAQHRRGPVAPAPAAGVLEPCLGLAVAAQRRRIVVPAAIACSSRRSSARCARGRRRPRATYSRSVSPRSRGGRWSCSATRAPFCERELAALDRRLADERA